MISTVPERKGRHYVNPYIRLGQASNLNLNPGTVKDAELAEKLRKEEI